jgi:hypothetical protein
MLSFILWDIPHLEVHAPTTWPGYLTMHVLIEVSKILEGSCGMVVEVQFPYRDLSTEEKKKQ